MYNLEPFCYPVILEWDRASLYVTLTNTHILYFMANFFSHDTVHMACCPIFHCCACEIYYHDWIPVTNMYLLVKPGSPNDPCLCTGASLMSVEDALESNFIRQNIEILHDEAKSFWIGLHRSYTGLKPTYVRTVLFRVASVSNKKQPEASM